MKEKEEENGFTSQEDVNAEDMTVEQENVDAATEDSDKVSEEKGEVNWKQKYEELNDSYLRLQAEFDNYRKRTLKERAELIKTAGERVMVDMLPVVDDFERAIGNIENSTDINSAKEGVELIYNKFVDFLLKNGVKKMDVIGQPFDVDKHEALTTIPAGSQDQKDKIVDCVQCGYEMGDKVIRFPKVIVAK